MGCLELNVLLGSVSQLSIAIICIIRFVHVVQSQDTNQAVQHEREVWLQEKAALCQELEQMRRDVATATPSRGTTSPPKSPSPNEEDTDLEISMSKVSKVV